MINLVVLPGWGHDKNTWKMFSEMVDKNITVFDLPGFGNEKLVDDSWGIPEYSQWVEKKIKGNNIVLLGHSFGGRVAAEIAAKNPTWLRGLILSAAPCIYRPTLKNKIIIQINKYFRYLLPSKMKNWFLPHDLKESKQWNMEKIFKTVVPYDQTNKLKKISVPTLIIWGENDKDVPLRIAHEMRTMVKRSNLEIIKNAGHNCFLDNQYLFYGYVKNFIKNIK